MKKLFISCPMNGRKSFMIDKSMKQLAMLAEAVIGEHIDVIDTNIKDSELPQQPNIFQCQPERSKRIWYLGESIKRMKDADLFIGLYTNGAYPGCDCEWEVAHSYGIPVVSIPLEYLREIMPDVYDKVMAHTDNVRGM